MRNPAFTPSASAEHTGVIKWFNLEKGFGFITLDSGRDIFVHASVIDLNSFSTFEAGQRVRLTISKHARGTQATNVRPY
nr:cold shock domain-containing protein [Streptomyces sp. SBE_14.2]